MSNTFAIYYKGVNLISGVFIRIFTLFKSTHLNIYFIKINQTGLDSSKKFEL